MKPLAYSKVHCRLALITSSHFDGKLILYSTCLVPSFLSAVSHFARYNRLTLCQPRSPLKLGPETKTGINTRLHVISWRMRRSSKYGTQVFRMPQKYGRINLGNKTNSHPYEHSNLSPALSWQSTFHYAAETLKDWLSYICEEKTASLIIYCFQCWKMADPLSIAASIIGILTAAQSLSRRLRMHLKNS